MCVCGVFVCVLWCGGALLIVLYWLDGLCIDWMDCISWIVLLDIAGSGSYRLDWLDWINWIGLDHNGWMRTHSFMHWIVTSRMGRMVRMGRMGPMGRMDWMGRWWD